MIFLRSSESYYTKDWGRTKPVLRAVLLQAALRVFCISVVKPRTPEVEPVLRWWLLSFRKVVTEIRHYAFLRFSVPVSLWDVVCSTLPYQFENRSTCPAICPSGFSVSFGLDYTSTRPSLKHWVSMVAILGREGWVWLSILYLYPLFCSFLLSKVNL